MKNKFKTAVEFFNTPTDNENLYSNLWFKNTTALLHGSRDTDKISKALEIAVDLADQGDIVFFLTTKRLSDSHKAKISANHRIYVHRSEYTDAEDTRDYADIVIADIEEAISATAARVFIIDSITRIAGLSFGKNSSATYIMKRLVTLQLRHKISLLVIANDSTRAADRALLNLSDCALTVEAEEPLLAPTDSNLRPVDDAVCTTDNYDKVNFRPEPALKVKPRAQLTRQERRKLRREAQRTKKTAA